MRKTHITSSSMNRVSQPVCRGFFHVLKVCKKSNYFVKFVGFCVLLADKFFYQVNVMQAQKGCETLYFNQCFSTGGSRPTFGSRALTFGSPKPVLSSIIVTYGSPNCALLCFVGRQLPKIENHWFKRQEKI